VPLGKVGIGSGEQATLNLTGDNFLQVAVPANAKTADGQALIDVSGKVRAAGGLVQLKAATVARAIRNAVNVPGELSVASARASGGSIILSGGFDGNVSVSGKLTASGLGKGGTIAVSGRNAKLNQATLAASSAGAQGGSVIVTVTNAVSLASTAVDVSGATGGGAIRIGGDFHGASDVSSAQTTWIDSASTLNASATASGNGGTVVVWSNGVTSVRGVISAQGGPWGGDGGQVETSGETLDYAGLSVNASSLRGKPGSWLLDPEDLTVDSAAATTIQNSLNGGTGVTLQTTFTTASGPGNISSGAGDINVDAPISWSTSALLTLSAFHSIIFNAPMTISGAGNLALITNNNQGGTSSGGVLTFTQGQGSVQFTGGPAAGAGLNINGTPYTLLYSMGQLQTDINGNLGGSFALADNLVSTTTFTGAVVAPNATSLFTGVFEGLGHTISNLTIRDSTASAFDGLFGVSSGTIQDIGLINASVSNSGASSTVGSLVGFEDFGLIQNAYASGAVSGGNGVFPLGAFVGGLVGVTFGSISNSHATSTVSGGQSSEVGGLAGDSNGSISNSYATGAVTVAGGLASSTSVAGGLVGLLDVNGTITNANATGAVNGGQFSDVGGLVGETTGSISDSRATGTVSGGANSTVGGLVGFETFGGGLVGLQNLGDPISNSYATGAVSGGLNSFVGGLVGEQDAGTTILNSYATGAVNGGQLSDVGGLVGEEFGSITSAYATGAVSAGPTSNIGGLVGALPCCSGSVTNGYWDTQTTGQAGSAGATGLPTYTGLRTAQLEGALPAGFATPTWATGSGLYPFLTSFFPNGVQAVSGSAFSSPGNPLVSGPAGANTVTVAANGAIFGPPRRGPTDTTTSSGRQVRCPAGRSSLPIPRQMRQRARRIPRPMMLARRACPTH
jgi:hypothetical protein